MPANPRTPGVALLVSILKANWNAANTDGNLPTIVDDTSGRKEFRAAGGWVTVYEDGPYKRSRDDTHGDFKTHKLPLTIEVHAQSRTKHENMLEEVERIINAVRLAPDPAGYWDWIEDLGQTPVGQYPNSVWSKAQIELWANSISVAT